MSNTIVISSPSSPAYWDRVLDAIPFPVYVVDAETYALIRINRTMAARVGNVAGMLCHEAIYRQDKPCNFCRIAALKEGTTDGYTLVFEHFNDADDRWYQLQETLVRLENGRVAKYSIGVDISTMKSMQNALAEAHAELAIKSRELERLSITDRLTGLYNRHKLDQVFDFETERAHRSGAPMSVVVIDLDGFKSVNDTHGHRVGDKVLVEVADILQRGVRRIDTVGRWGGEEFLVICADTDEAGAATLAEKLRGVIEAHSFPVGKLTASFGVAQLSVDLPAHKLIERADAALYLAKRSGRNRVERWS